VTAASVRKGDRGVMLTRDGESRLTPASALSFDPRLQGLEEDG
jgi:hypothetical protein